MNATQRNVVGFAMLGAGLVVMLIAAAIAWSAVQRWIAVSETREAFEQLRRGNIKSARNLAASAAARVPDEPTPALLAADPADGAALDRLVWIATRCQRLADRQAVFAAIGLMRLAAGKPADVELAGTADGRLLEAIAVANAGRDPGRLKAEDGEAPPHLNVLRAAHTVLLRRSWQAGKVSETRAHAGALLLLQPKAKEAPALLFLLAASSPTTPDDAALKLGEVLKDERDAVVRAVAALVPLRRDAIAAKWPKAVEGLP
jgi:hypothetical protein